jgi:outer membrane protein OmpA-like peptidoglycan-associated protein
MPRIAIPLLLLCSFGGAAHAQEAPPQRFVIFFTEWSAAIDHPAQEVIAHAAEAAKAHPRQTIRVTGLADTTGSQQANILLSELRAQRVADELQADGIAAQRIKPIGRGSVRFAYNGAESRRVEIAIGDR